MLGQLIALYEHKVFVQGADLEHRLLRPVGRRARQGPRQEDRAGADRGHGRRAAGQLDRGAGRPSTARCGVAEPMAEEGVRLRPPNNTLNERAVGWWRAQWLLTTAVPVAVLAVLGAAHRARPAVAAGARRGAGGAGPGRHRSSSPLWWFRVHRWEVTDEAVYVRTGCVLAGVADRAHVPDPDRGHGARAAGAGVPARHGHGHHRLLQGRDQDRGARPRARRRARRAADPDHPGHAGDAT